jgi:hypothetical protein
MSPTVDLSWQETDGNKIMKKIGYIAMALCCLSGLLMAQDKILWDGEVPDPALCNKAYGTIVSGADPHAGNYCFRAEPDNSHSPRIGFNCTDMWRADISAFDQLRFFIKCNQTGQTTSVRFTTYFAKGKWVNIDQYLTGGGPLSTTYQEVKIPLDSLKTASYDLSSVEYLEFGTSSIPQVQFFVDDISVSDLSSPVVSFKPVSEKVAMLNISERFDTTGCYHIENYTLASPTDANYQGGVHPKRVGRHHHVTGLKPVSGTPVVAFELFLIFDKPLINGQSYQLTAQGISDMSGNKVSLDTAFTFSDDAIFGNVKVNQVGYLPNGPKLGKLGNFLGDQWGMEVDTLDPPAFEVVTTAGQPAFTGQCKYLKVDTVFSGEWVFDLDFSSLKKPGEYYLRVPGYGRSEAFHISNDVYKDAYFHSARALYYQRTGAIEPAYGGEWAREGLPATVAEIHSSHLSSPLHNQSDPLPGTQIPMTKGWLDAGDYGRYVPTAASALFILFTAFELYPQKFPDNHLQIPESGNNIPDLIDELKYETDWLKLMQAPDGGVYFRVTPATWSSGLPEDEKNTLFVSEKTTQATASFAAAMAMAHRNFKPFFPAYADTCLDMAKKAWQFLKIHPEASAPVNVQGISAGPYPDPEDRDNRAWAAAELFKTTGEDTYHQDFVYWYGQIPHEFQATMSWQQLTLKAIWAYSTTKHPTLPVYPDEFKNKLNTEILPNYHDRTMNVHPYHGAYHPFKEYIGYGSFGMAQSYAFDYIMFSHLLNKPHLLDSAQVQLDIPLGNNPLSMTFLTGIGKHSPQFALHWSTVPGKFATPVPGIPVFGPAASLVMNRPSSFAIQDSANRYPYGFKKSDPYPVLRRYTDAREAVEMAEFTVQEIAVTLAAFAFFSPPSEQDVRTINTQPEQDVQTENRRTRAHLQVRHPSRERYDITLVTGDRHTRGPFYGQLFSSSGMYLKRVSIKPNVVTQIDLTGFSRGIYILKITNGAGDAIFTRKLLAY